MPGGLSCWRTTNVYQMIIKPGGTHTSNTQLTMAGGSDNTDEDSDQEEQPATPWNELSIVERVGLNSMQLPEEELESAFAQIALAFRCDQYTLKQRLQAEEHARNLAEENVQLELTRGRETLETLKDLCLDSKRSKILQSLELSLDILGGTVERIANTAEQLGAVHQEARVCRAVEIMVAHMEHLKRRHDRDVTELEESKKLVHRVSRRHLLEPRVQPDADEVDAKAERKSAQHFNGRRRVSVSVISKETQEKRKRDLRKQMSQGDCPSPMPSSAFGYSPPMKDGNDTFDGRLLVDPGATWSGSSALQLDPSPIPEPERPPPPAPPKEEATRKTLNNNLPLDNLRQRHRGKAALSKRKTEKDKKSVTRYRQLSLGLCGLAMRRPPQTPWLHRHRWVLPCTLFLLLLLLCIAACSCGSSKVENSEDLIGVKSN